MATGPLDNSDHICDYYRLLGVAENASDREIIEAFRHLSRERHPDRNRNDEERATRDFQNLAQAKIVLLDEKKRRKHDEELIDNGVRNRNALPLLCSICTDANSKGSRGKSVLKCLRGFGHKSPLIEEFQAAKQGYHSWMKKKSNVSLNKREYIGSLQKVLKKFTVTDWSKLYPLAAIPKPVSQAEKDSQIPDIFNEILKDCSPLGENQASGTTAKESSNPSTADVVKLLNVSLVRESKRKIEVEPTSIQEFPMYDLSSLSKNELEQIYQYFGLWYDRFASRDFLAKDLSSFIPTVEVEEESNDQQKQSTKACQRCAARTKFWFLGSFTACFICSKVCCQNCLTKSRCKVPTSGSFILRPICKECLNNVKSREAEKWLKLAKSILTAFKTSGHLETSLAMYRISYELYPSAAPLIAQAQALFSSQEHARLIFYGKKLLRTTKFQRENEQIVKYLVAESLLRIAHDADHFDLSAKADKYQETVKWIEGFLGDEDARIHDVKVTAMKMRLGCIEEYERITRRIADDLFSRLTDAIRKGSLTEMIAILQYDEEVLKVCLKKLIKEPPESYDQNGKLCLALAQATAKLRQNDSFSAINQVADVLWNGYALFQASESNMCIVDYVIYFTCLLLERRESLPLEALGGISCGNFLQCLQLTEDDLRTPPDIDCRKWENLDVTGCNMKMFYKYELAGKKLVQANKWSPIDAALSYYDLVTACNHPSQVLTTLITSAQWFARQMSRSHSDKAFKYGCKKMIMKLTNLAAALAFELGSHPYQQFYVARMVLGLQFYAFTKTMFGSQEDAESIGQHLKWLVAAGRLCPLHKIPIVTPTESVLMHLISQELHCKYLLELQDEIPSKLRPMSEAILRYQIYENHWLKRCELQDPTKNDLRLSAMTALLTQEKWSWDGVQHRLHSDMIALDREGWLVNNSKLLGSVASSGIQRLVGLEINKKDFSIHLLIEKGRTLSFLNRKPPLLSWQDIATGLIMEHPGSFFSLEAVCPQETLYHPFNKMIFSPNELEGSQFLYSMFHTDYLLKQLSMGFEMQSYPPFQKRPVSEGLLKDLPSELKKILLPIPTRGSSRSRVHRLWIQADSMEYDVQEDENSIRWLFGDVNVAIRCMPMFHTKDGVLHDQDVQGPDDDSPEGRFVADFTKYYDQIGRYLPEFLRLKELCKVQWLGTFIKGFEEALVTTKERLKSKQMDALYARRYSAALKEAQNQLEKKLDEVRRDIMRQLSYISDDVVRQVRRQLTYISATESEISRWLHYGDSSQIAQRVAKEKVPSANQIRQKTIADHEKNLQKFKTTAASLKLSSKECLSTTKSSNECPWVPAVCHTETHNNAIRCLYGGVALTPTARKVSIPMKRFFSGISKMLLTSNFIKNNANVRQPPPKAFNPLQMNGTKLSGKGGSGSGSLNNSGGSGSGDTPSGQGGGGDGLDWKKLVEKIKQNIMQDMGKPIATHWVKRSLRQFHKSCPPGMSPWETALNDFASIPGGGISIAGDTEPSWKMLKSALQNIKQGKPPPNPFGFKKVVSYDSHKLTITVRQSHLDTRPTLEIFPTLVRGKRKCIKIRYGEKG